MGRQYKYSFEDKIKAAKDYISGTRSCRQICLDLGIKYGNTRGGVVRNWAKLYQAFGESIFMDKPHNKSYSADLKLSAVEEYLTGTISQLDVCIKYEIYSTSILRRWIKKYNSGIELKNYDPKQEVYMAESKRKTTIEER